MVKVTCKESGIEFEAKTKRTIQHPLIAELKAKANRYNKYGETMKAIEKARGEEYETVEEFVAIVNGIVNGKIEAQREAQRQQKAAKREREEKEQREKTLLVEHGYTLEREAIGTEEDQFPGGYAAGIGEFSHYRYYWQSPDGRRVSRQQALDEIARGADVVLAEIEAEKQAAQAKREEKERIATQEKTAQDKLEQEERAAFDALMVTLDELQETTVYPDDLRQKINDATPVESTSFKTLNSTYRIQKYNISGETIYQRWFGGMTSLYAPRNTTEKWWLQVYQTNGEPSSLRTTMTYGTYGADYREWLRDHLDIPHPRKDENDLIDKALHARFGDIFGD
ncbi:MAG: hypothetical protein ACPG7F_04870 [Aggregatilineales bacterium]